MKIWIRNLLLMLFALTTTQWAQAKGAASVNGNDYTSIEAAIEAAKDGDVVYLNLAQMYTLPSISKNVTITKVSHPLF